MNEAQHGSFRLALLKEEAMKLRCRFGYSALSGGSHQSACRRAEQHTIANHQRRFDQLMRFRRYAQIACATATRQSCSSGGGVIE